MTKTAIGIDLGGTRIKAVVIDAEGNVLHELYQPTNDGDNKVWKNGVISTVVELQGKVRNYFLFDLNHIGHRAHRISHRKKYEFT